MWARTGALLQARRSTSASRYNYRSRAVDHEGTVLDSLVQRRRDKTSAKTFFRRLLEGSRYVPRLIVTDRLKRYRAAKREILPGVEHRQHRSLNNRAEHSLQPTRQRERRLQGFTSAGHVPRFLAAYGAIAQHSRLRHHLFPAPVPRPRRRGRTPIRRILPARQG
jgi:putative transposase